MESANSCIQDAIEVNQVGPLALAPSAYSETFNGVYESSMRSCKDLFVRELNCPRIREAFNEIQTVEAMARAESRLDSRWKMRDAAQRKLQALLLRM